MKKKLITAAVAGILFSGIHSTASADGNTYTVKSGDTLWKISNSYHLTIDQLMNWNKLSSTTIKIGQTLVLSEPENSQSSYIVVSGDTLWKIASSHGISIDTLKNMNNLLSDSIYPGQKLIVSTSKAPSTLGTPTTYTVKSGDSLWSISNQYKLTVSQLKEWNQLTSDVIYTNQVLYLTNNTVSPNIQTSDSKKDQLVIEAKKYIGVPYKWGGSTPTGFDCSGYINYVFNNVGIPIPRTVSTIWSATTPVSTPEIGDIVFFNTSGSGASHAGIYLGNNKFIHAGSSTGVTISDLTVTYWKSRYLGARTPFN